MLFITLLMWGFHAVGTVKANVRGLPTGGFLFPKKGPGKKERGEMSTTCTRVSVSTSVSNAAIHVTTWMDSKPVNVVSTFPTMKTEVKRNTKDKAGNYAPTTVAQPTIVKTYNYGMGGTDRMDQQISYYATTVRTRNWQHRTFTHFISVAVVNAHILYKAHHNPTRRDKNYDLKGFIDSLLDEWATKAHTTAPQRDWGDARTIAVHQPMRLPHMSDGLIVRESGEYHQKDHRRECPICHKKAAFECSTCNKGLHIPSKTDLDAESCWEKYHRQRFSEPQVTDSVDP